MQDSNTGLSEDLKKKYIYLIVIFVLFLYPVHPFIHECGHALAALRFGGKIMRFTMFPQPKVVLLPSSLTDKEMYVTALAGAVFPCFFSFFYLGERLTEIMLEFCFKAFGILDCVISLIVAAANDPVHFGKEDATIAMQLCGGQKKIILLYTVLILLQALALIKTKPLERLSIVLYDQQPKTEGTGTVQ